MRNLYKQRMIGIASFFFLFQKNFEINARDIYVRMISFVRRVKEKMAFRFADFKQLDEKR